MVFDEARVRDLLERDGYASALGIRLDSVLPHLITLELDVEDRHTNFYDLGHGGMVFSLADCALSLASNTEFEKALAIDAHIALSAASRPGDRLVATVSPAIASGKLATYRVDVARPDGQVVAVFTGTVYITTQ